jgi:hypothetical protein
MEQQKNYKTLADVLNAPAEEGLHVIAACAGAIERIDSKSGILDFMIDNQGKATDTAEGHELVKMLVRMVLKHALGDCMEDCLQIVAAVNNTTVAKLKKERTGLELVQMIKTIVTDRDFFTSLASFAE